MGQPQGSGFGWVSPTQARAGHAISGHPLAPPVPPPAPPVLPAPTPPAPVVPPNPLEIPVLPAWPPLAPAELPPLPSSDVRAGWPPQPTKPAIIRAATPVDILHIWIFMS